MIYITLGTQACDFSRCLRMAEDLVSKYQLSDRIVAQIGYTSYRPSGFECVDFIPENEYQQLLSEADVVISHAGTGALFSSIKKGKKIIAVARLAKYGEMLNDHQIEIVHKLASEGYILDGTDSLIKAWDRLPDFQPKKIDFQSTLSDKIEDTLSEWGVSKKLKSEDCER